MFGRSASASTERLLRSDDVAPPDPEAPAKEEGVVEVTAGLRIREYRHALLTPAGPRRFRTFLTEGLRSVGATEVRVTVPATWDDAAVAAATHTLTIQERFARDRTPATLGGFTEFSANGIADGRRVGVTYGRGMPALGIPGSSSALTAVLLNEDELAVARRGLAMRILGHLAHRTRHFPYPPWWEVRDGPVLAPRDQASSVLKASPPRVPIPDVRVTWRERRAIDISLPATAGDQFNELWAHHPGVAAFLLTAHLAPSADGQIVWIPGAKTPSATAIGDREPRRVGLAFAMIVGTTGPTNEFRLIEDGAGLVLTNDAFARLRDALRAGDEFELPMSSHTSKLRLTFRPPSTGLGAEEDSRPDAEWECFEPAVARLPTGRVAIDRVDLLTPSGILYERVGLQTMANLIESVIATVEGAASTHPVTEPLVLGIEVTLASGTPTRVAVQYRGAPSAILGAVQKAVEVTAAPASLFGEISFRLECRVSPNLGAGLTSA
jgi:hypothetical protein